MAGLAGKKGKALVMTQITLAIEATVILLASMLLVGCTLVSEIVDSSGCMYSTGGPVPGMASGLVLVCRSGKNKATVHYRDNDGREITIIHE